MRMPAADASAQRRQTRYMPPFFAILVCTTVAARRRITSRREWSVETDSSAMIGMLVARQSAARPSRSQMAEAARVELLGRVHQLADGGLHRQEPADADPVAALAGEELVDGQADRLAGLRILARGRRGAVRGAEHVGRHDEVAVGIASA